MKVHCELIMFIRPCTRILLIFMYVRKTQPHSRGSTAGLVPIPTARPHGSPAYFGPNTAVIPWIRR